MYWLPPCQVILSLSGSPDGASALQKLLYAEKLVAPTDTILGALARLRGL